MANIRKTSSEPAVTAGLDEETDGSELVSETSRTSETKGSSSAPSKAGGTNGSTGSDSPPPTTQQAPVGLLSAMWRYRVMCVVIVVACTALSAVVGIVLTPEPTASATIALKTPSQDNVLTPGSTGDASLSRYTAQRARFVTSDAVMGNVAAAMGTDDLNALRNQLEITPSSDSNILTITASGSSGADAVELASEVARAYAEETQKQVNSLTEAALKSIDESAASVRSTITTNNTAVNDAAASTLGQLQQRQAAIRTSSAVLGDGVEFVVKPDDSSVASSKLPVKEIGLGFILGLVIAGTAAYLRADSEAAAERAA